MHLHFWQIRSKALWLVCLIITLTMSRLTLASDLRKLDGEWIYVEDRTEGRQLEKMGPPMSSKFSIDVEEGLEAIVLNGHGSGHRDVRIVLDGTLTEIREKSTTSRYRGRWDENTLEYEVSFERAAGTEAKGIERIKRSFRITPEGLVVSVSSNRRSLATQSGFTDMQKIFRCRPRPLQRLRV